MVTASFVFGSLLAGLAPAQSAAPKATPPPANDTVVEDKGWVEPSPDSLRAIFKARFKRDLGEFELLKSNEEEWTRPYITRDGSQVYVGARSGRFVALDPIDGELVWQRRDMGTIGVGVVEYGSVVVLGSDSDLVALDRSSGQTRWKLDINGRIGGLISVEKNVAVVPVRPNAFIGVDLEKGEQLWRVQRQTPEGISVRGQATPTLDPARQRAYLGFSDGALLGVNLSDGGTRWIAQLGKKNDFFADVDARPLLIDEGKALLAASYNGGLFRLNPDTGEVVFKQPSMIRLIGLSTTDDPNLVVASYGDGQILGVYPASGKVRWRYRLKRGAPTDPVSIGGGYVMVGCTEGPITFLRVDTGKPIQIINLSSGVSLTPYHRAPYLAAMSNTGLLLVFRQGS